MIRMGPQGVGRGRRNKFNAVKTEVDGYTFDSKKEARRYGELKMLGVKELHVHPTWPLDVNGIRVGKYSPDFEYTDENGNLILEDVKGGNATRTAVYQLKKKLMRAIYNIEIREI